MNKFIEKAASAGRVHLQDDLMTNLTKLKIIKNGKPALAAMLLFGKTIWVHLNKHAASDFGMSLEQVIKEMPWDK